MGKYFSIQELVASREASLRHIDNTPSPEVQLKLNAMIDNLLDPIREKWGAPLAVNSGFRCRKLNSIVGGVSTSQHVRGEAADITAGSPEKNRRLFDMITAGDLPFDQLIDESDYAWIHISYKPSGGRRQVLHL